MYGKTRLDLQSRRQLEQKLLARHLDAALEAAALCHELHPGSEVRQVILVVSLEDRLAGPIAGTMQGRYRGDFADWLIVAGDDGLEDVELVDMDLCRAKGIVYRAQASSHREAQVVFNSIRLGSGFVRFYGD